jgi:hypothetical protein
MNNPYRGAAFQGCHAGFHAGIPWRREKKSTGESIEWK